MTPPERKLALKQLGPLPIYARVKAMVADKILCGEWRPNDRVPSETELVQQLGFSRMTINRALRELTAEGLLVRMQGVGTFVAEPKGSLHCWKFRILPTRSSPDTISTAAT